MKRLGLLAFSMAVVLNSFAYSDYSYPKLETPWWLTFMGLLMIAWGILEIILFFKIWGMTNDVRKLVNHFCGQTKPNKPEVETKPFHIPANPDDYELDDYDRRLEKPNKPEVETKPFYIPANPDDYELDDYDRRLDDVKAGDKVRRASDGKILEVVSVGEKALECRGGMLDGIHTYPKDALSIV